MPATLFSILDNALASAASRSGDWLACHPGCHQCCIGVFPLSALDAENLRDGLQLLDQTDPPRADSIRTRAAASRQRLTPNFPGNPKTGELFTEPEHEAAFEDFANDEPCPVLDPTTGTCDLYAARPVTCRTFGPPVFMDEGAVAVCELCFVGAPEAAVTLALLDQSWRPLEATLIEEAEARNTHPTPILIAFALT